MLGIHACRWDENNISFLPEYMKKFFLKVTRNFEEFEDELEPHEKYRVAYVRKAVCNNNYHPQKLMVALLLFAFLLLKNLKGDGNILACL